MQEGEKNEGHTIPGYGPQRKYTLSFLNILSFNIFLFNRSTYRLISIYGQASESASAFWLERRLFNSANSRLQKEETRLAQRKYRERAYPCRRLFFSGTIYPALIARTPTTSRSLPAARNPCNAPAVVFRRAANSRPRSTFALRAVFRPSSRDDARS